MTDAHNPRVLSDADAAADLAGVPRPSLPERAADRISKGILTGNDWPLTQDELDRLSAASWIRTLVSERDALAVRVRELEGALRDARTNMADWASYAGSYFHQKYDLAGDLAAIDAALTQQEKTNG